MKKLWILAAVSMLASVAGCGMMEQVRTGKEQSFTRRVDLGSAKSVEASIDMSAGTLNVSGGSAALLDSALSWNVPAWKPVVDYNVSGGHGTLEVSLGLPGHVPSTNNGDVEATGNLRFNSDVPLDLTIELGAGESNLHLAELNLTRLHLETGAGKATIDLAGNWSHDVDAHIEGGVGQAVIKLPRSMGVRATVEGAIGSVNADGFRKDGDDYVNDAYGKSPATINLQVEGGVGEVDLQLAGGPTV